ncbi:DUF418 domain-containing protein [Thalassotalea euphylliae]|uniref:DUF418 domain-containing protein n=1 Tax=Thalassotalea euphylliae TaxID=1655234 RepID=UPI0015F251A3|nr:DUF418 domain-containing protein [Thalassotalea euphylliae]
MQGNIPYYTEHKDESLMAVSPITTTQRLINIDIIRGVALLGILIMNIQAFAMVEAAYGNPTAFGDLSGINFVVYYLSHLFADQKFMTLFSVLFGTSMMLMADNIRDQGRKASERHYRRLYILAAIGILHSLLLWWGDILFSYAIAGLIAFQYRDKTPKALFKWAVFSLLLCSLLLALFGLAVQAAPADELADFYSVWQPTREEIALEIALMQSGWLAQLGHRFIAMVEMMMSLFIYLPRIVGLMLVGMALYKLDVYRDRYSNKQLLSLALIGLMLGLALTVYGNAQDFANGWPITSMFFGLQYSYWGSLGIACAYLCLLLVFCRLPVLQGVKRLLANVGQMALTNYLSQSLICGFVFYGWGLGLFGELARYQQLLVVFFVWAVLISVSQFWLARFRFGPCEWLWRSLTYKSLQPLRRQVSNEQPGYQR